MSSSSPDHLEREAFTVARNPVFCGSMLSSLNQLRTSNTFTDFTIKVSGREIACHRLILTAGCPYFAALFSSGMKEVNKGEVSLDPLDAGVLEDIVHYIYSGEISINYDKIKEAVEACDFLQLSVLKSMFCDHILKYLSPDNCVGFFKLSDKLNLPAIEDNAKRIMLNDFHEVSTGEEFMELSIAELIDYIKDEGLLVKGSDPVIMEACFKWVKHDQEMRQDLMPDIVKHIKMKALPLNDLAQIAAKYEDVLKGPEVQAVVFQAVLDCGKRMKTKSFDQRLVIMDGKIADDRLNPKVWSCSLNKSVPNGIWSEFAEVPADCQGIFGGSCICAGALLKLCGNILGLASAKCAMLNFIPKTWEPLPAMPEAAHLISTAVLNNSVYVLGGRPGKSGHHGQSSVFHLDLETKQWHTDPPMLVPQFMPITAVIGSKIYVVYNTNNFSSNQNCLQMFDTVTQTWTFKTWMPRSVRGTVGACAVSTDQYIYVVGGNEKVCTRYDTAIDKWTVLTGPIQDHEYGSAVLLENKIYLCGGGDYTTVIEQYDILTDTWQVCQIKMPEGVKYFTVDVMRLPKD